jgi:DNA-binding NarL/FixJ family response regulator
VDLVILDLGMPGMNGLAGLDAARRHFGEVPVVVISGSTARDDVVGALERGAAGYIPKTLSSDAMLKALELVISGESYLPAILLKPDAGEAGESAAAGFSALTAREREVLELLTEGLSNRQIAERLAVQEVTVKAHLQPVYRKLGVANRTQAVTLALSAGIGR